MPTHAVSLGHRISNGIGSARAIAQPSTKTVNWPDLV
jgi:hypothetical protein